jgi:hypothetical protein
MHGVYNKALNCLKKLGYWRFKRKGELLGKPTNGEKIERRISVKATD